LAIAKSKERASPVPPQRDEGYISLILKGLQIIPKSTKDMLASTCSGGM
jgi:hypothetical protein